MAWIPIFLREEEDGIYYEGCTEEEWWAALKIGTFADGWEYSCRLAQSQLLFNCGIPPI